MSTTRKPDFGGWATKNDLKCGDGRIICRDAFAVQDGKRVPMLWNHDHSGPENILGHAILHNREDGVWADCYFNDGAKANAAKDALKNGDVNALSIFANRLKQNGPRVEHGVIREVSLVLAGANPGALIESVMCHGSPLFEDEEEGQLYTGEPLELYHADSDETEKKEKDMDSEKDNESSKKEKTVQDVLDTLNPEQKRVVNAVIGMALESAAGNGGEDDDTENNKEDTKMAHNAFEGNVEQEMETEVFLSHSDVQEIMRGMKAYGSLRESWNRFVEDRDDPIMMHSGVPVVFDEGDKLVHAGIPAVPTTGGGLVTPTGSETYGFQSPDMFYPDARPITTPPEFIGRDQAWVSEVLGGVHTTPFSRVKSWFADITEDEARARGYIKGKQKVAEVFKTLKRVTTPTTIYKMQKLDRDDIIDITDFDVVAWIRAEMRLMLNEEIARAILIGDGRTSVDPYKINEENIRPIATDADLFTVKLDLDFASVTDPAERAKAVIDGVIRGHKNYRGSGNPVFFTTEDWVTEMLLLEDKIGHKLYKTMAELATALRVSKIVTVELMEDQYVDGDTKKKHLIGVIVNMRDYNIGRDRGGEVSMFDDFDIDYNQQKYLIETRMSGALTRPFSAIAVSYSQGE